jgi:hypothetical protein
MPMKIGNRIADIIISTAILLALAGSMHLLIRVFIREVGKWKLLQEKPSGKIELIAKMVITVIMVIIGVFFGIFCICVFWFPDYHISPFWRLAGIFLAVPYLACIFVLAYGLSSVVAIANVSSARMFSQLFGIKSKSVSETKKEVKKHKTANNSEVQPDRVPGKTQGEK